MTSLLREKGWRLLPKRCAVACTAMGLLGLCLLLSACIPVAGTLGRGVPAGPTQGQQAQMSSPQDRSEQIGSGPAHVALILPLTQSSGPSIVGTSLRNAAELAVSEAGSKDITLLIDQGRPFDP